MAAVYVFHNRIWQVTLEGFGSSWVSRFFLMMRRSLRSVNFKLAQEFLDDGGDGAAVGDFLRSPFAGFEKKDFAFDGAYGVHGYGIFGLHGGLDVFLDLLFEVHFA